MEVHKNDPFSKSLTGKPILYWPGIKNEVAMFRNKSRPRAPVKPLARVDVGGGELQLDPRAVCFYCGLDGWWADVCLTNVNRAATSSQLRECLLCGSLAHPDCLPDIGIDGKLDTGLARGPNWWTCPHCILCPPSPPSEPSPPSQPLISAGDVKMEPVEAMDTSDSPRTLASRAQESLQKIQLSRPAVKAASLAYQLGSDLAVSACVLRPVLEYLPHPQLCRVSAVCSAWRDVSRRLRASRSDPSVEMSGHQV